MSIVIGTNGSDILNGTNQGEIVLGGNGNDVINGSAGNDILDGGNGNDTVNGGADNDIVSGGNGNDVLDGSSGSDLLLAGNGNDVAVYVAAENTGSTDWYLGGNGQDRLRLVLTATEWTQADIRDDVMNYLAMLGQPGNHHGTFLFSAFNLAVTQFETLEVFVGGQQVHMLLADPDAGAAVLDLSSATTDQYVTVLGDGDTQISTGSGNDTVIADDGDNTIDTGAGNDTVTTGAGDDVIRTGSGADTITIGDGDDVVDAGSGNDVIVAGQGGGDDLIDGEAGNDTVTYPSAVNPLTIDLRRIDRFATPTSGGSTVGALLAAHGYDPHLAVGLATGADIGTDILVSIENATGGNGDDTIFDNSGTNVLVGGAGNDTITVTGNVSGQSDAVTGGNGIDTLIIDYAGATNAVQSFDLAGIPLGGGTYSDGADHAVGLSGIEHVFMTTGSGNDQITTGNGDDQIATNGGSDTINGGNGNDTLDGGSGADTLAGGDGDDTYFVDNTGDDVTESLNAGTDTIHSTISYVLDANVEHLTLEGAGNINATDNGLTNILTGNAGDNTFTVSGNVAGQSDAVTGGDGFDTLFINWAGATNAVLTFDLAGIPNGGGTYSDGADHATGLTQVERVFMTTGSGNDNITTGSGNDQINTGSGTDTLHGGNGNDVLIGGAGSDTLQGGGGTDRASYATSPVGLTADLGNPGNNTGDATGDTYSSIENLEGSGFDDILRGDAANNSLFGGAGADQLDGGLGSDFANYGTATTALTASLAAPAANTGDAFGDTYLSIENLRGSNFDDTLIGDGTNNFLQGGPGADALTGGAGSDWADYNNSTVGLTVDLLTPANNTGEAVGNSYSSMENIRGGAFNDVLRGNNGNNFLRGGLGADTLVGRDGNDTADFIAATAGLTIDLGTPGNSTGEAVGDAYVSIENLRGSEFADVLRGNGLVNLLDGAGGADTIEGDTTDYAWYQSSSGGVTVSLANPGTNTGDAAGDSYISIRNLAGSNFDDTLIGDDNGNFLRGQAGADVLDGGLGLDWADYTNSSVGLTVDLLNPANNTGDAAGDSYISIENVQGGAFDDILRGDDDGNFLHGGAGNDTLVGRDGLDQLHGGAGADALDGGSGWDWARYDTALGAVTVDLGDSANNLGEAQGDTYTSIEVVVGSAFDDILRGDDLDNHVMGGPGADTLEGVAGSDTANYSLATAGVTADLGNGFLNSGEALGDSYSSIENLVGSLFDDVLTGNAEDNVFHGGLGADALDGSDGIDTADYFGAGQSEVGVTVDLDNAAGNLGTAAGDTYVSIENVNGSQFDDFLFGDGGNNALRGAGSHDTLDGRGGDDRLNGGADSVDIFANMPFASGDDLLTGGSGNDTFAFGPDPAIGADTITDFVAGAGSEDVIEFSSAIFAGFAAVLDASQQVGNDVVITRDAANTVTLQNVLLASLHQDDFLFV